MALRSLSLFVVLLMVMGCSKDKYASKPNLKMKMISSTNIQQGEMLTFTIEYTDKEGDLAGVPIVVQKIVPGCALSNYKDSAKYTVPSDLPATANQKGELQLYFPYVVNSAQCPPRVDTAVFKFWLRDKGGNLSDTLVSPKIVIH